MSATAALDLPIINDLQDEVAINPETYQDQMSPAPPAANNYRFRVKKLAVRKDKDGNVIMKDGKYPTFVIEQLEIVEAANQELVGRVLYPYADISTKPFQRTPNAPPSTKAGDLLRAFDDQRAVQGLTELTDALREFVDQGATFQGRLDWIANDSAGAKEALEAAGITGTFAEMTSEEQTQANQIYKAHKLRGMKKFPSNGNGGFVPVWTSPSGNTVEAKPDLTRFYKSSETVKL